MSFELPFELPLGWEVFTVDELVKNKIIAKPLDGNHGGTHPKASDYVESGIPFVMASDLSGGRVDLTACKFITHEQASGLRKGFSKVGDVLLSHKATIGRTAIVQDNDYDYIMLTPQVTYYRVLDESKLSNIYLKSYFDSRFFQNVLGLWAGSGSTRAYLGITGQLKLPVIVPPIEIQKEISGQVNALTKKVTVNNQINQTLEEMAQAIFKSWFVDFDPVKANMNGEQPEGMDAATASLFPEKLVESDLGGVPFGWDVEPLDSIFTVNKGLSYKGKFLSEDKSDVPLINLGNFGGNGTFRYEKVKYYSGDYKPRHVVKAGQLVIANTDMTQDRVILGSAILVPELGAEEYLTTHHTFSTSFKKQYPEDVWKYFVFYSLQRPSFRFRAEGFATGTTVLAMPKDAFTFCTVALPPVELVEKFSALVQSLKQKIACNEKENVELTNLRDTLLPKLLSGEIELGISEEL